MPRPLLRRLGFALPWIILTLAIVAVLVATAAPALLTINDRERAANAAAQLRAISAAFVAFGDTVGHYPGRVSELTNVLRKSDLNTCQTTMTSSDTSSWPKGAPYVPFYTDANGTWTDIGRIRDAVVARSSPAHHTPIYIQLPGVTGEVAIMLELIVDNFTGDTVTYAAPVNDTTTITYRVVSTGVVNNNEC